jgi:rod shape-determining protein MreC
MDNGTPALFRQGLPAGMRLAIFASLSVVLMLVDGKMQTLEAFRESIASYVIRPAEAVTEGTVDALASGGKFFTTVSSLTEENEQLKKKNAQLSFDLLEFNRLKAENAQLQSMAGVRSSVHISSLVGVIQGETADAFTHHLDINLGSSDKIEPGMPVFDENGVLGQISRVRADQSEITLLSDPALQFPVLLPRSGIRCATTIRSSSCSTCRPRLISRRATPCRLPVSTGSSRRICRSARWSVLKKCRATRSRTSRSS